MALRAGATALRAAPAPPRSSPPARHAQPQVPNIIGMKADLDPSAPEPDTPSTSASAPSDMQEDAQQSACDQLRKDQTARHIQGARTAARADLAATSAVDALDVEKQKQQVMKIIKEALGVNTFVSGGLMTGFSRKVPKVMFLFMIVGCEIDVYGFMMAFSSYWALDIFPLHFFLVAMPLGYCIATIMFMYYAKNPETEVKKKDQKEARPTPSNPLKSRMGLRSDQMVDDEEVGKRQEFDTLHLMMVNNKETVILRYYHFIPITRFYMVIKDQNPHDVEGLFRVNSLSSFTLGVAQLAGMAFASGRGVPFDLFMKVNVASQIINWFITFLYFATGIASRMKASFKVDILLANSVSTLRNEYESYLHAVQDFQQRGGGPEKRARMVAFHDALQNELSEFVNQPLDLQPLSMEDKYLIRQAVHRRMYGTYVKIN